MESLRRMCDIIAHRGPDAEGQESYFDGRVFLGHRRLSIIDLSPDANQPLCNEDGSVSIAYNGEVYNYQDFRPQLESKGHVLRSSSDTETLVHLYEDLGVDMLSELNGMFAFSIWDDRKKVLFCARDAFGIKPFYYTHLSDGVAFSSEIKALLVLPDVKRELDRLSYWQSMSFRYVSGERTMFSGIKKLLPGHYMLWRPGRGLQIRRWSERDGQHRPNSAQRVSVEEVQEALQQGVRRQLVADVPVGSLLSGGLDSSLVTALMCRSESPMRSVRTYTVGYGPDDLPDRKSVDRTSYIDQMQERYPINCRIIPPVIDPNDALDLSVLKKIIWHVEEPVCDTALVNAMRISAVAREDGTPVLLCGHGADEIFGGYRRHRAATYLGVTRKMPSSMLRAATWLSGLLPSDAYRISHFLEISSLAAPKDLVNISFLNTLSRCRSMLSPDFLNGHSEQEALDYHLQLLGRHDSRNTVDAALHLDQWTYLVDQNLLYMDKLSMAHSIETRVPFLDQDLFDLAARIPTSQLVTKQKLKAILHHAAEPYLPSSIVNRPKSGFGVLFLYEWWKSHTPDWYEDLFSCVLSRGWYDDQLARNARRCAEQGDARASEMLLTLLLGEVWAQCFLDTSDICAAVA